MINTGNGNFEWSLILNPTVAGTFTYASYATNSIVETVKGVTANVVTGGTAINGGIIGSTATSSSQLQFLRSSLRLGSTISGTPDTLVLCVRPLSANESIEASMTWREVY